MTTSPCLTRAERKVLLQLVERGHINYRQISAVGRETLRRKVCSLRKKLDPSMRIVTVHGGGYWLERAA